MLRKIGILFLVFTLVLPTTLIGVTFADEETSEEETILVSTEAFEGTLEEFIDYLEEELDELSENSKAKKIQKMKEELEEDITREEALEVYEDLTEFIQELAEEDKEEEDDEEDTEDFDKYISIEAYEGTLEGFIDYLNKALDQLQKSYESNDDSFEDLKEALDINNLSEEDALELYEEIIELEEELEEEAKEAEEDKVEEDDEDEETSEEDTSLVEEREKFIQEVKEYMEKHNFPETSVESYEERLEYYEELEPFTTNDFFKLKRLFFEIKKQRKYLKDINKNMNRYLKFIERLLEKLEKYDLNDTAQRKVEEYKTLIDEDGLVREDLIAIYKNLLDIYKNVNISAETEEIVESLELEIKSLIKTKVEANLGGFLSTDQIEEIIATLKETFELTEEKVETIRDQWIPKFEEEIVKDYQEKISKDKKSKDYRGYLKALQAKVKINYLTKEIEKLQNEREKLIEKYQEYTPIDISRIVSNSANFKFDVPPVIKSGRTLVPIRAISEAFNAEVTWNAEEKIVTILKDEKNIEMDVDDEKVWVNGEETTIDIPAKILNGRTVVPLRFISETLEYDVHYDSETGIIEIDD